MIYLLIIVGFLLITWGASLLVKGASRLAVTLGISSLVVGLTMVAFGTSAPELAVGLKAALDGKSDIVFGNVVGSNIFNILLVLGLASLIVPISVEKTIFKLDVPVMAGTALLLYIMALDGNISRIDGIILVIIFFSYIAFLIYSTKKQKERAREIEEQLKDELPAEKCSLISCLLLVILGLAMLVIGAEVLVNNAVKLALNFGVSELVIGITVIAIGTSLPELATSVVAGIKGEQDISIGNIVGSNIFNIVMVIGFCAIFADGGIDVQPVSLSLDIPMVILTTILCIPIFLTGFKVTKLEGLVFLICFGLYMANLYLHTIEHNMAFDFKNITFALMIIITLSAITKFFIHRKASR